MLLTAFLLPPAQSNLFIRRFKHLAGSTVEFDVQRSVEYGN